MQFAQGVPGTSRFLTRTVENMRSGGGNLSLAITQIGASAYYIEFVRKRL